MLIYIDEWLMIFYFLDSFCLAATRRTLLSWLLVFDRRVSFIQHAARLSFRMARPCFSQLSSSVTWYGTTHLPNVQLHSSTQPSSSGIPNDIIQPCVLLMACLKCVVHIVTLSLCNDVDVGAVSRLKEHHCVFAE